MDKVLVQFRLDRDLLKRLDHVLVDLSQTRQAFFEAAVQQFVELQERKK